MQNAKDTFYKTLRARLATLNPERTTIGRVVVRTAGMVAENELEVEGDTPMDTFVLRWGGATLDRTEPQGLDGAVCTITFATRGTPELNGMDRGRVLEALGHELHSILQPAVDAKQNYTGDAVVTEETNVFWSEPAFADAVASDSEMKRTATVHVFALGEAGAA